MMMTNSLAKQLLQQPGRRQLLRGTHSLLKTIGRDGLSTNKNKTSTMTMYASFSSSVSSFPATDEAKSLLLMDKNHGKKFRLAHSSDPIPYTGKIEITPVNDVNATSGRRYHGDGGSTATYRPSSPLPLGHKKVTVVGCGHSGMAIAYAMLNQATAGTIALVDIDKGKLYGEAKDLEQGSAFHQHVRILASDEYSVSADSHLVIITAGTSISTSSSNKNEKDEDDDKISDMTDIDDSKERKKSTTTSSRLDLLQQNVQIMKDIIPKVLAFSPNAVICIVTDPCDVMTAVASKIAGPTVPPGRIFGSGTCLDSSRLRSIISKKLNVDTSSVSGYIVGEHGDSCVPIWSSIQVGGIPLLRRRRNKKGGGTKYGNDDGDDENGNENDMVMQRPTEIHDDMHLEVVQSAYDVIRQKGYTNWAGGLATAHIANAVLDDTKQIMPVSTCVRDMYGNEGTTTINGNGSGSSSSTVVPSITDKDVFLSMPCAIGASGVERVLQLPLTESEETNLRHSADTLWNVQKDVWDKI